ncbi:MAG: hypothetical protein KJ726_00920, partial [Verrucomicrobia bacterium]|nr:hypothetical protein [Verrucomicrobiota bacterium]
RFYLEPGVYEVQAEDCWAAQRPVQTASIEYKGEELVYTFDFTAGVLSMRTLKNGAPSWAFVRVNRAGTDDKVTEKDTSLHNPLDIKLLPGIYDLEFFVQGQRTPVGKRENIEIKPGETTSLEFSF